MTEEQAESFGSEVQTFDLGIYLCVLYFRESFHISADGSGETAVCGRKSDVFNMEVVDIS